PLLVNVNYVDRMAIQLFSSHIRKRGKSNDVLSGSTLQEISFLGQFGSILQHINGIN
uniref:Uncharacterized protein n=1 Tax=Amphimedon queenslandica TaxID=400682 RepID=A0A1X7TMV4_AMPQE